MEGKIGDRKAEIYTYESDNVVYGLSWSVCHPPCIVASLVYLRLTPWLRHHVSEGLISRTLLCIAKFCCVRGRGLLTNGATICAVPLLSSWRNLTSCISKQNRRDKKFRLAVGSFLEERNNHVEVITRACSHTSCHVTHDIYFPHRSSVCCLLALLTCCCFDGWSQWPTGSTESPACHASNPLLQ